MATAPPSRSDLDLAKIDWRRVDATTDEDIARQVKTEADTAPLFTADEILAAGRRIVPDEVENVRALRGRLGLSQHASASRSMRSASTNAVAASRPVPPARCCE